jgi:hypothetical protein
VLQHKQRQGYHTWAADAQTISCHHGVIDGGDRGQVNTALRRSKTGGCAHERMG